MSRLLRSIVEFVVGDDPGLALGVAAALAVTAGLSAGGIPAWWVLPVAVPCLLAWSLRRLSRRTGSGVSSPP